MKMEKTSVNAIATAKRNLYKYDTIDAIADVVYKYNLRIDDEVPVLVEAVNNFANEHYFKTVSLEAVKRYI